MELLLIVVLLVVVLGGGALFVSSRRGGGTTLEPPPVAPPTAPAPPTPTPPVEPAPAPTPNRSPNRSRSPSRFPHQSPSRSPSPEPVRPKATFRERLGRARSTMSGYVGVVLARDRIDAETWDDLEEALIRADVGVGTTTDILDRLRATVAERSITEPARLLEALEGPAQGRPPHAATGR